MEYYQNNVILDQQEERPSVGLPIAAMVLGIVGAVLGLVCYMVMIMSQVQNAIATSL